MSFTPSTSAELYAAFRAGVLAVDPELNDFRPGSNLDALASATAIVADETQAYALDLYSKTFVAYASGDTLRALVKDRYNLDPKSAVEAEGYIFWTGTGSYTVPAGTEVTGTLSDGGTFSAFTTVEATSDDGTAIPVRAADTGIEGNVAAGTLDTVAFGADPTATISQSSALSGGAGEEGDEELRARALLYIASLEKGTRRAVLFAALSTPGVRYAFVDESFTDAGTTVNVYVADPTGAGNTALANRADANVQVVRPITTYIETKAAALETKTVMLTVTVPQNTDQPKVKAAVTAAAKNYLDSTTPGETWYASKVDREVHNAVPAVESVLVAIDGARVSEAVPTERWNSLRTGTVTVQVVEVSL